jgi:hypothetical protein
MLLFLACAAPTPKPDTGDTAAPAVEVCNGVDDNGDGAVDEGVLTTFYADADGDGFGGGYTLDACAAPSGYAPVDGDCDDADAAVNPDAAEVCDESERDENCDVATNNRDAVGCTVTYDDDDGDGLGGDEPECVCDPTGLLTESTDCDDRDPDRGVDCTVGEEVPLVGATVRDDDPDVAWSLLGAYDAGPDATGTDVGEALFLTGGGVTILSLPDAGDTTVSTTRLTTEAVGSLYGLRALGDLDGSGAVSMLEASIVQEAYPYDPHKEIHYDTATIRAASAPLLVGAATAWIWELDRVMSYIGSYSLYTADLDGDGIGEGWYSTGAYGPYGAELGIWRLDAASATRLANVEASFYLTAPVGDADGDGLADLAAIDEGRTPKVLYFPGPITDTLPPAITLANASFSRDLVPLGDVDGDGYDDLALVGQENISVLRGPLTTRDGEAPDARIGTEDDGESSLFITAGDVGADGTPDLVFTDLGANRGAGAVYTFHRLPSGVVDASAADTRVYGTNNDALGSSPQVLDDGRVLVGAHTLEHADGVGAFFLLEGL